MGTYVKDGPRGTDNAEYYEVEELTHMKTIADIKEILIAGGGLMGKNIAFVITANPAFHVKVYDLYPTDVEAGIRTSTGQLVDGGYLTEAELARRLSRIYFTTDIDDPAIAKADLVIEAVFEDMKIKRETFAKLEARCAPDCIFCTNSSVMSPSEISAELQHRERFVGTHLYSNMIFRTIISCFVTILWPAKKRR